MNPIWSLFTLTACSFSQHVNLSCISSFTSITCVFSPYTNAFIFWLFTMIEHVCSLLLGAYVSYISSFMFAYLLFAYRLMFSPFTFAILFCSCLMGKKGVKSILGAGSFYLHFCRLGWILKEKSASFMNLMCWPLNMINSLVIWEQMIIFSS